MTDPLEYPQQDAHELMARSLEEAEDRVRRAGHRMATASYRVGAKLTRPDYQQAVNEEATAVREFHDLLRSTFAGLKADLDRVGVGGVWDAARGEGA